MLGDESMSDLSELKEMTKAKAAQEMTDLKDKIIERLSSIKRDGQIILQHQLLRNFILTLMED
jgi:hypothetical protein